MFCILLLYNKNKFKATKFFFQVFHWFPLSMNIYSYSFVALPKYMFIIIEILEFLEAWTPPKFFPSIWVYDSTTQGTKHIYLTTYFQNNTDRHITLNIEFFINHLIKQMFESGSWDLRVRILQEKIDFQQTSKINILFRTML